MLEQDCDRDEEGDGEEHGSVALLFFLSRIFWWIIRRVIAAAVCFKYRTSDRHVVAEC